MKYPREKSGRVGRRGGCVRGTTWRTEAALSIATANFYSDRLVLSLRVLKVKQPVCVWICAATCESKHEGFSFQEGCNVWKTHRVTQGTGLVKAAVTWHLAWTTMTRSLIVSSLASIRSPAKPSLQIVFLLLWSNGQKPILWLKATMNR